MATWNGVITNAGNSLLNEWVNEKALNFDSAAAGQGTVALVSMLAQTALVSQKQAASILGGKQVTGGIRLKIRIAAPTTAYTLNQFGVWASVTGGSTTMIALFQLEDGIPIPSKAESPDFVYTFYALISCSNTGTWTVTVDTIACVTQGDMTTAIAQAVSIKQDKITVKGLLMGDGAGNLSAAVAGKDYGYPLATGSGTPTAATAGTAGQHYYDSATSKEYICTGKSADGKFLWKLSGISDASEIMYDSTKRLSEKIAEMDASMLLTLAAAAPYDASQTYALGTYCTKDGKLYRCTTAISAAEDWTAGHWTETTMGAELVSIYTTLANKAPTIHAVQHAARGSDPIAPEDIGAEKAGAAAAVQKNLERHTHDDRYLRLTGGTLAGNLTGKYIAGTWLQATEVTDLSRTAGKVAVLDDSGWVYYRTVAELLADLGIPDAASIRATTAVYGTTKLSTSITSTSKTTAATPYAVKAALDKAKQYTDDQIKVAINSSY